MSTNPETKRWGRTIVVMLGVGLLLLVPLIFVARHMITAADARARVTVNEAAAIDTIDLVAAAEQIHLDAYGQYATIPQLIDAQILNMKFANDPPVFKGYAYSVQVTPKTETRGPAFSVNADPVHAGGDDATGARHFYRDSEVAGIRYHEARPATAGDTLLPRVVNAF